MVNFCLKRFFSCYSYLERPLVYTVYTVLPLPQHYIKSNFGYSDLAFLKIRCGSREVQDIHYKRQANIATHFDAFLKIETSPHTDMKGLVKLQCNFPFIKNTAFMFAETETYDI